MKKLLLSGASGYLGRNCIPFLLSRSFTVTALSSGKTQITGIRTIQCNLLTDNVRHIIEEEKPDFLLHFAWYAEHGKFWESEENIKWLSATAALVSDFFASGGKRAVIAGTCAEYDWSYGYCREYDTPASASTLYGASKNAVCVILEQLNKKYQRELAWVRIFHLFGGSENPNRLVPYVIQSLLNNEKAVCSKGTQLRDFLHIEDAASAFAAITDSDVTGIINIGSGSPVTIRELVMKIGKLISKEDLVICEREISDNDPLVLIPSLSRLFNEVGWKPAFTVEEGLQKTVNFWKSRIIL